MTFDSNSFMARKDTRLDNREVACSPPPQQMGGYLGPGGQQTQSSFFPSQAGFSSQKRPYNRDWRSPQKKRSKPNPAGSTSNVNSFPQNANARTIISTNLFSDFSETCFALLLIFVRVYLK